MEDSPQTCLWNYPFQERLCRCSIHIYYRDLFLDFLLHFILPFPFLPLPKRQGQMNIGSSREEVGCLPPDALVPTPNHLSCLPQSLVQGTDGRWVPGTQTLCPQDINSTEPQRFSYLQIRSMARTTTTGNLQFTVSSSQYLLLMMPQALVLPDKICPHHRLAKIQGFPSLCYSQENEHLPSLRVFTQSY